MTKQRLPSAAVAQLADEPRIDLVHDEPATCDDRADTEALALPDVWTLPKPIPRSRANRAGRDARTRRSVITPGARAARVAG